MHINNVHIHIGRDLGSAALAALMSFEPPPPRTSGEAGQASAPAPSPVEVTPQSLPKIADAWPGIDGVYAGVSRGEEGEPDAHLVLLNVVPERDMNWADAIAWAQGLGDGARLPTRFESALIYANLRDKVDTNRWHWTGTQYSGYGAWYQSFGNGGQYGLGKKAEARCRAVRRLIL